MSDRTNEAGKIENGKEFKKTDLRGSFTHHEFRTDEIDIIETYGKDSDIKVRTIFGERYIFRCSCCVQFLNEGRRIRIS